MAILPTQCAAVILCGGQSRRLGRCKARLCYRGESWLARLLEQLQAFDERWLATNDPSLAAGLPAQVIADAEPGLGPLAGLTAALSHCHKPYLLCLCCDQPLFTAQAAQTLLAAFCPDMDALICRDAKQQLHPLNAIYAQSALPKLRAQLAARKLSLRQLLPQLRCHYYDLPPGANWLYNVNTPEDLAGLAGQPLFGMGASDDNSATI